MAWKQLAHIDKREYDASCISDYLSCPKLFYYRWIRELLPIEEAPPLVFGRVIHTALLSWYTTHNLELALKCLEEIPKDIGDDRRTKEHASVILTEYTKRYTSEPYTIKQSEVEFAIDMSNGRTYSGRIDQIVEWNGQMYVKDHKTTSQLGLSFYRSFRPSVQMDGYCYACRELCGSCSGVIINGISVAANPKERFGRDISSRTAQELDRFKEQFGKWCEQIEISVLKKDFFSNYTSCSHWGQCNYLELCIYGEDERTLELKFKKKEA